MLDSYSLDANQPDQELQYQALEQAYLNIYKRCSLPVAAVQADAGGLGGIKAQEYMYLTPIGEDDLLFCDQCGYSANRQIARFNKPRPQEEILLPLKKIATPHTTTIEACRFAAHTRRKDGQSHIFNGQPAGELLWRTRKRTVCLCSRPRRYGGQRNQTGQCD